MNNHLPVNEIDGALFNRFTNRDGSVTMVAEASDINFKLQRLFADACDTGIAIKSPRTGRVERFALRKIDCQNEDVVGWRLSPLNRSLNVEVLVIND